MGGKNAGKNEVSEFNANRLKLLRNIARPFMFLPSLAYLIRFYNPWTS